MTSDQNIPIPSRRGFLKAGASIGALAIAGPAFSRLPAAAEVSAPASRQLGFGQAITGLKLDEPLREYKTEVRWWLAEGAHTEQTIKESVQELADSGFAGLEFAMLNEPNVDASKFAYGSQEWVNDVKLLITEATKYGLGASFTSGTNWSTANIPGLDPNSEAASHDVGSAHAHVPEGTTLTTVPAPAIGEGLTQSFVSAVAYRLAGAYTDSPTIWQPLQLDVSSAVDLSEDAADGRLSFTADDGDWLVFTFWYRGTAQQSLPAIKPAYCINYFGPAGFEALKNYWESYLFADGELVATIRKNGRVQMFMDSLEYSNSQGGPFGNGSMFWTKDMKETFQDIKGYDITPYLPVFIGTPDLWTTDAPTTGTVDFSSPEGKVLRDKVLADLRDVQTRLYMENLMTPLREWLNEEYGVKLRAQISYGKNLEISEPITVVDYAETETRNQRDQTDIYRVWAGGAHLQNKVLSSETAADDGMNYGYSLQKYLQKNYRQYASGVSRVVWHGYASRWGPRNSVRWPGYEAGMGSINGRWGSRNPSSKDYNEYNDHLGRVQTVLRAGQPQVDLAILYSDYAYELAYASAAPAKTLEDLKQEKHEGWQWKDLTLQDAGYTYDYFAPQYLDGGYAKYDKATGLLAADGPSYQALLIYQNWIPIESARTVLAMARQGLKVIVVQGAMTQTRWNDGRDSELDGIRHELQTLANVHLVQNQKDAYPALTAMKVHPRVAYSNPGKELLSVIRRDENASYLFLYNSYNAIRGWNGDFTTFDGSAIWDPDSVKNQIEVAGTVKPYLLDTWTGEISEVAEYTCKQGKTIIPVEIPDGDVRIYIFKETTSPGLHVTATDGSEVLLAGGTITVRSTQSGDHAVELSDHSRHTVSSTVPSPQTLTGWDVNVESWSPGDLSAPRSETTVLGNYTEEYTYQTKKTNISFRLGDLVTWNNIDVVGRNVSGIGTYKTTFQWDKSKASGAYLDLGRIVESATVFVNGTKTQPLNLIEPKPDIPGSLLKNGENTLEIVVTTPLANTMLSLGYNGGALTEGPRPAGRDINGNPNYRFDQVYTYFDHGLPQAVLTPYVDLVLDDTPASNGR